MKNTMLQKLVLTSVLTAVAITFEFLNNAIVGWFAMPFGGNFLGIAMIPLVIIGFICGLYYGLAAGLVFGVVQIMLAPAYNIVGLSFLLDYLIGFTAYGLTGLFFGKLNNWKAVTIGILLAGFVRYLSVSLAGVVFWGEYADGNVWIYSFIVYNLGYNFTSTFLTLVIVLLMRPQLSDLTSRYLPATS